MKITKTIFRLEDEYGYGPLCSKNKVFSYGNSQVYDQDEIKFFKSNHSENDNFKKFCNNFSFSPLESFQGIIKHISKNHEDMQVARDTFKNSFRFGCNSLVDLFDYFKPRITLDNIKKANFQINVYDVDSEFVYSSRYQSFFCIDRAQKNRIF